MEITNELINSTYAEYKVLLDNTASKYKNMVSPDEIENCKLHAVYKTLLNFNENKKAKFSTFLCNNMRWEIFSVIRKDVGYYKKHKNQRVERSYEYDFDTRDIFLDIEKDETRQIVFDRLIGNMSYHDIGKKHNVCKETARKNFLMFLEDFKQKSV